MTAVILDRGLERTMITRRRRLGLDRRDEVWNGVYVMAPEADNVHQEVANDLGSVFAICIKRAGLDRCAQGSVSAIESGIGPRTSACRTWSCF